MDCKQCGEVAADDRETGYRDELCPRCRAAAEDAAQDVLVPEDWEDEHVQAEAVMDEPLLDEERQLEDEDFERWRETWVYRRG